MRRHIPNTFTLLNLTSGFIAIIMVVNGNVKTALILVAAALIFDFADGFAARLLKAYSPLGKELDSLADLVTFGVFPGLLAWFMISAAMPNGATWYLWLPWVAVVVPALSALRLAKFNVDTEQTYHFLGLATPANAFMILSLAAASQFGGGTLSELIITNPFIIAVTVVISSALTVTRIPLLSLKIKDLSLRSNTGRLALLAVWVLLLIIMGATGLIFIIPAYIVISLLFGAG